MILSIDIGGTAVKMGLVDEGGEVHARHEASVCFDGYRTPILTTVMREAEAFLRRENAQVAGIGVSATGQVDDRAGVVIGTNGKIPGYEGSRIKEEMESRFHLPVWRARHCGRAGAFHALSGWRALPVRQARMSGALCGDDGACSARTGSDGGDSAQRTRHL